MSGWRGGTGLRAAGPGHVAAQAAPAAGLGAGMQRSWIMVGPECRGRLRVGCLQVAGCQWSGGASRWHGRVAQAVAQAVAPAGVLAGGGLGDLWALGPGRAAVALPAERQHVQAQHLAHASCAELHPDRCHSATATRPHSAQSMRSSSADHRAAGAPTVLVAFWIRPEKPPLTMVAVLE